LLELEVLAGLLDERELEEEEDLLELEVLAGLLDERELEEEEDDLLELEVLAGLLDEEELEVEDDLLELALEVLESIEDVLLEVKVDEGKLDTRLDGLIDSSREDELLYEEEEVDVTWVEELTPDAVTDCDVDELLRVEESRVDELDDVPAIPVRF
jgi:hypothetical protein